MAARFTGIPADAFAFYAELAAHNDRTFWSANKHRYDAVRAAVDALSEQVRAEFGPLRLFRPQRDIRFSADKTPYKTNAGAVTEGEGGQIYYVSIDADGLQAGSGYYAMGSDQLVKYRAAVDDDQQGEELAKIISALRKKGFDIWAHDELKTAPRGFAKDHPRIDLLRRKGLAAGKQWPLAPWMHTATAATRVVGTWRATAELIDWLAEHVGPSTQNPFER